MIETIPKAGTEREDPGANQDPTVVHGFGDEWTRFDQTKLDEHERRSIFDGYFRIFPWDELGADAVGCDVGCGSGRWAKLVAPRVGKLYCVDASADALKVAQRNLATHSNIAFAKASVDQLPFPDRSLDFAYSLGVLHHVPDTQAGLDAVVAKLKPGAPFLLYLYYAFDGRPWWFRLVWKASELLRFSISRLPMTLRSMASQIVAACVYWPLARVARVFELCGMKVDSLPLSAYRDRSFYSMRTDALDRLGTRLEQRFTRLQIAAMMERAGLTDIVFSDRIPFWVATGRATT